MSHKQNPSGTGGGRLGREAGQLKCFNSMKTLNNLVLALSFVSVTWCITERKGNLEKGSYALVRYCYCLRLQFINRSGTGIPVKKKGSKPLT